MSKLLDTLRENPEYVPLRLGGAERGFLLSVYGCELAAAAGEDPLPHLAALAGPARAAYASGDIGGALTTEALSALAVAVWAGLLPFDPDLRDADGLAFVKASLTPGVALGLVRTVVPKALAFSRGADGDGPEGDADGGGDEGN